MALQTDFMVAVNQIAAERNIDPDEVLEAIKLAIKTGFKRDYEEEEEGISIEVEISEETGAIAVIADKKVVENVTNELGQISLEDAKKIESKIKVGDHIEVDVTPSGDFGRVAAQAAKQVILQKIRESEKNAVMEEFKDKVGDIEYGVVQRMDGDSVIFEIRRAIAVMPKEDRIPNEFYKSGSRLKVLVKEIRETPRGKQLIVSRGAPEFLYALFALEVPEIVSGSVEIKSIAREAGTRSKVAVSSSVEGVDPIGSCVGQKGVRINAIMNELKFGMQEEKIDIIAYDEDLLTFIANALSPAKVLSVEVVDEENQLVKVVVPDDQLSLAIGKEGQNARLAVKLTGWHVDVTGETITPDSSQHTPKGDGSTDSPQDGDDDDDQSDTDESKDELEVEAQDGAKEETVADDAEPSEADKKEEEPVEEEVLEDTEESEEDKSSKG